MKTATESAEQMKAFRKTLTLTQQALAEKLNVAVATVARWEAGRTVPSGLAREALERLGFKP